jgi:NADH:ubiquinone reductase (H+-translocating)
MTQRIVMIGSGFAGMWAALSAARVRAQAGQNEDDLDIVVVSPQPTLVIRPRLYEASLIGMGPDLTALFQSVAVRHVAGDVQGIDTGARTITWRPEAGEAQTLTYDRLVLAAGSAIVRPPIPGLDAHSFNVDQLDDARILDQHLQALAAQPESPARSTVIVIGGGFTGIETATELPERLRRVLGAEAKPRVIVLEQADAIGPDLGPGPRPVIEQAFQELGIELRVGATAAAIDAQGVTLADGSRIDASTVIWTAGVRASGLTAQIPAERDRLGRLRVAANLSVHGVSDVFAAGDVALAATDERGHHTLMSCQHAIALGRAAGHNAAADLLGLAQHPYGQPKYVTCLDLGPWGAVYTEGWERRITLQGDEAKALKRSINTEWIYPPQGTTEEILATADPAIPVVA